MLHALGAQRVDQGDYDEGEALLAASVAEARRAGDHYDEALSGAHLGAAAWGRGDHAGSGRAAGSGADARAGGRAPLAAAVASYLGLIAAETGDFARAATWHREWHAYDPEACSPSHAQFSTWRPSRRRGEAERAARLFGAAAVLTAAIGFPPAWPERGAHDQALAQARAALGGNAFKAAFDAGGRSSWEQVLAELEAVLDAAAPAHGPPGATWPRLMD